MNRHWHVKGNPIRWIRSQIDGTTPNNTINENHNQKPNLSICINARNSNETARVETNLIALLSCIWYCSVRCGKVCKGELATAITAVQFHLFFLSWLPMWQQLLNSSICIPIKSFIISNVWCSVRNATFVIAPKLGNYFANLKLSLPNNCLLGLVKVWFWLDRSIGLNSWHFIHWIVFPVNYFNSNQSIDDWCKLMSSSSWTAAFFAIVNCYSYQCSMPLANESRSKMIG